MAMHSSILLIEDSPGERELFSLALKQTGLDVTLSAEPDTEAALRFLEEQAKAEAEWKHTGSTKPGSPTFSSTLTSAFPPLPSLILLGEKRDVEAGLNQRQTKQFPLARAVVDQENGGMHRHYREV